MTSPRELIDSAPIGKLQIRVLTVCILANMTEGYDVLSMSIAAVPLSEAWGLSGTQTGLLLAIGPIGMAIGSIALAPLSDRIGRRPHLIASMTIIAVFLGLSTAANDMTQLATFRLLAGIGMGSMLPVLTIAVGEFAPTHRRPAAISVLSTGLALGGVIGGAGAAALMSATSWRGAFLFGAAITAAACVLVVVAMPETPDYLATRNGDSARTKLENLLARMGIEVPADGFSSNAAGDTQEASPSTAPAGIAIRSWKMVAVLLAFVLAITTYYFGSMWLPKLLVLAGMSTNQGISGVLLLTLGSAAAGLVVAALSSRFSSFAITVAFAMASAVLLGVFALVSDDLTWALTVAPLLGLCQYATAVGLYTLVPILFSPENRSAAMGLGVGIGRIGMITMPVGIGLLIDRSWQPESFFLLMIIPTTMAAALVYYLGRGQRTTPAGSNEGASRRPDTIDAMA